MRMRSIFSGVLVAMLIQTGPLLAGQVVEPYSLSAKAEQTGNTIKAIATIQQTVDGKPQPIASPRLTMFDGHSAVVTVGTKSDDRQAADKNSQATDGKPYSGVRIEFIKPLDRDMLVVATVVEKGSIIWTSATTVKVSKEPAAASQPANK